MVFPYLDVHEDFGLVFRRFANTQQIGDEDGILNKSSTGGKAEVGRSNRFKMPDNPPNTNQAIGKVTKYVMGTDSESYTEQLDFYFLANGVGMPKQRRPFF